RPVAATRTGPPPIPVNAVAPHGDRGACENCHVILRNGQPVNQMVTPAGANGINVSLNPQQPANGGSAGNAVAGGAANSVGSTNPVAANPPGTTNAVGNTNPPGTTVSVIPTILGAEFRTLDDALVKRFQPPYSTGVFLQSQQPGSLAESGGLQTGDIIFKVNGRWVRNPDELQQRLQEIPLGNKARFSLVRKRQRLEVTLTMTPQPVTVAPPIVTMDTAQQMPVDGVAPAADQTTAKTKQPKQPKQPKPPTEFEWFGMELNPIQKAAAAKNPALKNKQGALVKEVDPGLQAEMAGIRANDIVVAINGMPVGGNAELDQAIKASATAKTILLDVERDGKRMFVTLQ
ncbi:MAG: PDZ domain-containing protein, partial [Magnetococcales bacterium]|nr:PDZ domain-containing protein [Magnetococcales bacterium]